MENIIIYLEGVMKKILLLLVLIFTIISCDLKNAEKAFENGDYVSAVRYSTKYLDSKKEFPSSKESKKIIENLYFIEKYYADGIKNAGNIKEKISYISELREIRILLNNKAYDKQISFFTDKYDIKDLSEELAGLYYTVGLSNEKSGDFREAENNFLNIKNIYKDYGNYKDSNERYFSNRKKANEKEAEGYYSAAKSHEKSKNYCDARDFYEKASEVYAEHGNYKDTKTLYQQNDKGCKKSLSEKYYEEARKKEAGARNKYEYRELADMFYRSYEVYREYGSVNDAHEKYKLYQEKGIVKVYLENDLDNLMKKNLSEPYIEYVSYSSGSDITIDISERRDYRNFPERRDVRNLNEDGYNFREVNITRENELALKVKINVRGKAAYMNKYEYVKGSYSKERNYDGKVPGNYKNYRENKYESESTLYNWALEEARKDILNEDINKIRDIISGI